jgi:(p)ppGpp synthase/HD superfamily hydrolase
MQKYNSLPDAIALAEFAHRNQTDKAGFPYIEHPKRVLENVKAMGAKPYVQQAAILHDVVEDTAFSLEILASLGFSEPVLLVVDLVTRKKDVPSDDYYAAIRKNPDAVLVKQADIRDNLSPWRLVYLPQETQDRLQVKYARALHAIGAKA